MARERSGSRKRTLVFWLSVFVACVGGLVWWILLVIAVLVFRMWRRRATAGHAQ